MQCPNCNRELPVVGTHCPYCGTTLPNPPAMQTAQVTASGSPPQPEPERQAFCVKCGAPLPSQASFCTKCSAPRPNVGVPPSGGHVVQVPPVPGQFSCPRCGSTNLTKGNIAQWALIVGIVGAIFTCGLSLLLLLVKDPNRCHNCGFEFK